jgi:hypothetical protein
VLNRACPGHVLYDSSCGSCRITNAYADEWQIAERNHIARLQDGQTARQRDGDFARFQAHLEHQAAPVRECDQHTGFTPGCTRCADALVSHDRVKEQDRRAHELSVILTGAAAGPPLPLGAGRAARRQSTYVGKLVGAIVVATLIAGLYVLVTMIGWLLERPVLTVAVLIVAATAAMMFRSVRRRLGA